MAVERRPTRAEIPDLIARYGFVVDDGDLDGLASVFTEDAVFDLAALGGQVLRGLAEIREFFALGSPPHPVAHHTTNVRVVGSLGGGAMSVRSKWLSVAGDGVVKSGEYLDEVAVADGRWKIRLRVVRPRWFSGDPVRLGQPG